MFSKDLVKSARLEELKELDKHDVLTEVPVKECWEVIGKATVKVRWLDINKGDQDNKDYRSRLVAQEIKRDKREDLFAPTPSLEAKKWLLAGAVTEGVGHAKGDRVN